MDRKAKILLWWLGGLSVLFCAVTGWALSLWADFPYASGDLQPQVDEAKRLGLPLVASDLYPVPPLSESDNAASELLRAGKLLPKVSTRSLAVKQAEEAIRNSDYQTAGALLKPFEPALNAAYSAATKQGLAVPRDYDLGPILLLPEYLDWKHLASLLAIRAQVRARTGDVEGTFRDLNVAHRIAQFVLSEPILISMLVAISTERIRLNAIEGIAAIWKDDIRLLERLRTELNREPLLPDLRFSLRSEVFMGATLGRNLSELSGWRSMGDGSPEGNRQVDPSKLKRSGLPGSMLARAFMARHLEFWNAFYRFAAQESDTKKLMAKLVELQLDRETRRGLTYASDAVISIGFAQLGDACLADVAHRRTLESLIRSLEFRKRAGAWPKTLSEARADLIDPFTKKPLAYARDDASIRIYSLGADRHDHGGKTSKERKMPTEATSGIDIVSVFPPVRR